MLKSVLGYNRHTRVLKCAGCYQAYEIPKSCEGNPEKFAMLRENLEQDHLTRGCMEAAEAVEAARLKESEKVLTFKPRNDRQMSYREIAMLQAIRVLGGRLETMPAGQFGPN